MLSRVALVEQWRRILAGLPEGWTVARLRLTVTDRALAERAAALLGPAGAGRYANSITFQVQRRGGNPSPELLRRLLARLDAEGIRGTLKPAGVEETAAAVEPARERAALTEQWDGLVAELPEDWSDLYAEIELRSSDYLERGALLLAPVNPSRVKERLAYRFRVARRFGYGASPVMSRRCLGRLDEENVRGTVRTLWALSDTKPVYTQGPVWYAGGRAL